MYYYWIVFFVAATFALAMGKNNKIRISWILISIFFILLIGLRYEVGCDWSPYLNYYNQIDNMTFSEVFLVNYYVEPGHKLINWLSSKFNLGIYGVNSIYSSIFIYGLIKFSRAQPYPLIAFTAAIPYLIIVVSMGYSRQSVALGFILLALSDLNKDSFYKYIFLIIVSAMFHKSAILMLPLSILINKKKFLSESLIIIIPIFFLSWQFILDDKLIPFYRDYIIQQMQSSGTYLRIIMNIIPAIILFFYKKEWNNNFNDYSYWSWMAIISIVSIGFIQFASTAVDRIGLYFIPLQLVVFSRLPILAKKNFEPNFIKMSIILFYSVVLFVWLNFASHAKCWLPYKNLLF